MRIVLKRVFTIVTFLSMLIGIFALSFYSAKTDKTVGNGVDSVFISASVDV